MVYNTLYLKPFLKAEGRKGSPSLVKQLPQVCTAVESRLKFRSTDSLAHVGAAVLPKWFPKGVWGL